MLSRTLRAPISEGAVSSGLTIETVDYHTAGEPFRIVTGGVDLPQGATILERRADAAARLDHVRQLLVNEPRGHADMYGGFVAPPNDESADLGVVFFHNAGYSTACGHGTIALVTWALQEGVLECVEPETRVAVDVPSGRLETVASVRGQRVHSVRFRNVPAFVAAERLTVATSAGEAGCDVSFGGAFYAFVEAAELGLTVSREDLPALIRLGREIKHQLERAHEFIHPLEPALRDVYGVIFLERLEESPTLSQQNVTVFADGEVDRSPCGSGTSARLALLYAGGQLSQREVLASRSIINTEFRGQVIEETQVAGYDAVVTEIEGSAHRTGQHRFMLDADDPIGAGFQLR